MNTLSFFKSPGDINREIADRARARRKEKKFTQVELSRRSNVSLGSLKRFERTGEISLSSLIKIAFALECENDFDELFLKKGYASIQEVIDEQILMEKYHQKSRKA
ncbi:MAG: helix-turn-helix domain-containing protein [Lachnospiraceae bacterium]|nr:helix-turn-helix domain-containing protein [Lachnospiraceae bacterium]